MHRRNIDLKAALANNALADLGPKSGRRIGFCNKTQFKSQLYCMDP